MRVLVEVVLVEDVVVVVVVVGQGPKSNVQALACSVTRNASSSGHSAFCLSMPANKCGCNALQRESECHSKNRSSDFCTPYVFRREKCSLSRSSSPLPQTGGDPPRPPPRPTPPTDVKFPAGKILSESGRTFSPRCRNFLHPQHVVVCVNLTRPQTSGDSPPPGLGGQRPTSVNVLETRTPQLEPEIAGSVVHGRIEIFALAFARVRLLSQP